MTFDGEELSDYEIKNIFSMSYLCIYFCETGYYSYTSSKVIIENPFHVFHGREELHVKRTKQKQVNGNKRRDETGVLLLLYSSRVVLYCIHGLVGVVRAYVSLRAR